MFPVALSPSDNWTLQETIDRLRRHETIDGILLIGSTGSDAHGPASDYDLLLVLSHMPVPLHVALTVIDGRQADIIFTRTETWQNLLPPNQPAPVDSWDARLIDWLRSGQIAFDRHALLAELQNTYATVVRPNDSPYRARYSAWFSLNYNLQQNKRYAQNPDPISQMALDTRLLHTLSDLFLAYFKLRDIPWRGEKTAIQYLQAHDPAYLDLLQRCIQASDRLTRFANYEQLVAKTLTHEARPWNGSFVAVTLEEEAPWQPESILVGLRFWHELLGGG